MTSKSQKLKYQSQKQSLQMLKKRSIQEQKQGMEQYFGAPDHMLHEKVLWTVDSDGMRPMMGSEKAAVMEEVRQQKKGYTVVVQTPTVMSDKKKFHEDVDKVMREQFCNPKRSHEWDRIAGQVSSFNKTKHGRGLGKALKRIINPKSLILMSLFSFVTMAEGVHVSRADLPDNFEDSGIKMGYRVRIDAKQTPGGCLIGNFWCTDSYWSKWDQDIECGLCLKEGGPALQQILDAKAQKERYKAQIVMSTKLMEIEVKRAEIALKREMLSGGGGVSGSTGLSPGTGVSVSLDLCLCAMSFILVVFLGMIPLFSDARMRFFV